MSRQHMVTLIRIESERLMHYVNTLPTDALDRPSPCPGWTVGDVIAHLVWFADTYGGMMARGLRGDVSPPDGFLVPNTLSGPAVEALYYQGALAQRRELGATLFSALKQRYDWLNEMLHKIGPADWDKPCYHTRRLRPVHSFLPTIIQELAVHEWDIRSSLESSPALSRESIPVLMEKLPTNRRPWAIPFLRRSTSSGPLRYRFDLRDMGADIVITRDKARMEPPGEALANLHVHGEAETFVLLMYDRLSLDAAITKGNFKVKGDLERGLVLDFDCWLTRH